MTKEIPVCQICKAQKCPDHPALCTPPLSEEEERAQIDYLMDKQREFSTMPEYTEW